MDRTIVEKIEHFQEELTAIRHDLHAHPEIGMEEYRTAGIVAEKLEQWGIEVHRAVGKTGVVGILRNGDGLSIGLRADMDALPIEEQTNLPYASRNPGLMHACGHDGHTTMLLAAARYLSESRRFRGTVTFIFQPGEEGRGGAKAMLSDGLFERFPCDALFGMHNMPGLPEGTCRISPGPAMAGGARFEIVVTGKGGHGAIPDQTVDPLITGCHIATAVQSIISRNMPARETAVVSITRFHAGEAFNVIPEVVTLGGTARAMTKDAMNLIETRMRALVQSIAAGFGASAELNFDVGFSPLINNPDKARAIADAAADLVGEAKVNRNAQPLSASDDFAFMMDRVPGAYLFLGAGQDRAAVHNPGYDFNDKLLPLGGALFSHLVERELGASAAAG